ncbi:MAG: bifunctional methylenetetrahydrofolate dehydrogenase/methenyltetrahydrofolate cyclohydrolase FolD [Deltaproteobacteria bacterium]|nr:bifunctional methylenetetrahydrofolate dehydrogenase/methenyltetrahydrofolate cyclohydrolase FolD [Deltaproteobacteria bacterium]
MSVKILSGKELATAIEAEQTALVARLKARGIEPALAVILVGEDPGSQVYVGNKIKTCGRLGIRSVDHRLPASASQAELEALVERLNNDPTIHGILCQLPLPKGLDESRILRLIRPDKDVDCFHPENVGLLAAGSPRFLPCTPAGIVEMLRRNHIATAGKHAVVVGRSNIVGRPVSILLSQKGLDATVTVCHSRTPDLAAHTLRADILVAAIGQPRFITANMVKDGAVVIDVGMNRVADPTAPKGTRLAGDVDYDQVAPKCSAITPVPGGVGLMTIAMLMANTLRAAGQ